MSKDKRKLGEHQEMLPVRLTESELMDRARKMGRVHNELEAHQAKAALVRQKLKVESEELEEERGRLAQCLVMGTEPRATKVEAWANYVANRFEEIRSDTGEVINKRPLKPEDKQGEFDLDGWYAERTRRAKQDQEDAAKRRAGDDGESDA